MPMKVTGTKKVLNQHFQKGRKLRGERSNGRMETGKEIGRKMGEGCFRVFQNYTEIHSPSQDIG